MKIVDPNTRTTLLLNRYHEAFGVCTARAVLRHLINGRVTGIDATDNLYPWSSDQIALDMEDGSIGDGAINWSNGNIQVYEDHPVLRSSPIVGKERFWYIPTVVRCNRTFGYRVKGNKDISLRKLYEINKKICQYCLAPIPFSEATKDHQYPQSRGGSNHEFNLVLACRSCNNHKDSSFPYYDVNGNEVKPKKPLPSGMYLPEDRLIRDEWRKYLFIA